MSIDKSIKSEEDRKLEELLKQKKYSDEKIKKLVEYKTGKGMIPSEWESLMGMFGDRAE